MRIANWLLIFCGANLVSYFSYSQIKSFPYFQDFESTFVLGENVEFLPFWTANEVKTTSRIFKEEVNVLNGIAALGLSPTSTFSPTINISLDFSSQKSTKLEFYARSLVNGTGNYPAVMEISVSADQGTSFATPVEIGVFINSNTDYALYSFDFPASTAGQPGVVLKIKLKRGTSGSGTAAIVLMDDFRIIEEIEEIVEIPQVTFRQIQINEIFADPSGTYAPDSVILPNAEFIELFNAGPDTINLKDFSLSGTKIPPFEFLPGSYLILCSNSSVSTFSPFGETVGLTSWNTLTNSGEKILLQDPSAKVIDSLSYNLDWYRNKDKQQGGWSIEQINPLSQCLGKYNWQASESNYGGTPGEKNSVFNSTNDNTSLVAEKVSVEDKYTLKIHFNKPILPTLTKSNIEISPSLTLESISFSTYYNEVDINLSDSISEGVIYRMIFKDVDDCASLKSSLPEVFFGLGAPPDYNDLVISEIMADPSPVNGLPEAEYLELVNRSNKLISLKDVVLSDELSSTSFSEELIFPGEYVILCSSSSINYFKDEYRVISPMKWLSLSNAGERISLTHREKDIFSISYSDDWYDDSEKKEGGFSLEMANIDFPCLEEGNWFASLDKKGGTPGRANSGFDQIIDLTGPSIANVEVISPFKIEISFNEKIDHSSLLLQHFSINPSITIESIENVGKTKKTVRVNFSVQLSPKIIYNLQLTELKDCVGNSKTSSYEFAVPEKADSFDIIINELLFNPRPYGVDFVEIYNKSDKFISLANWKIATIKDKNIESVQKLPTSKTLLKPNGIIALTSDPNILINEYPLLTRENIIKADLPSLPDEGGNIVLMDSVGNVIDFFEYDESYHHDFLLSNEGVSLERISPSAGTNDKNNWHSASEAAGFATPGNKNSQSRNEIDGNEVVKITPKVFSPDGDGYNDFTLINFLFDMPGNVVSVKLYDKEGRVLKNLADNQTLAIDGFIQWGGDDDAGNKVKSGIYIVWIETFHPSGKKEKFMKEVIVATKL